MSYNQQSGEPSTTFTLAKTTVLPANAVQDQYFTYNMVENPVPGSTSYTDALSFGIVNSTAGPSATPLFQLNYSAASLSSTVPGTRNNMTYLSTDGGLVNAPQGFRTEKGSKVASISPTTLTVDFAKAVDELQFAVGPSTATVSTKSSKLYGPYSVGQATNLPNVSIGAVNASISLKSSNYSVSGISNVTATPSVSSATQPVLLKNLTTAPLVVLDSAANPANNLILVGSGYVNSLSQQLQSTYNVTVTPTTGPITKAYGANRIMVAGYTANQTTSAANTFIEQLYANAATG